MYPLTKKNIFFSRKKNIFPSQPKKKKILFIPVVIEEEKKILFYFLKISFIKTGLFIMMIENN